MKKELFNFVKWLAEYTASFFIIVFVLIAPYKFFTNLSWLAAWEWFHRDILVYLIWFVAPTIGVFALIGLFLNKVSMNVPKYLQFERYPMLFHKIALFLFVCTFAATLSQAFGGCIWQLPLIITSVPGYYWRMFGYEFIPWQFLIILYTLATISMGLLIHDYYLKYVRVSTK